MEKQTPILKDKVLQFLIESANWEGTIEIKSEDIPTDLGVTRASLDRILTSFEKQGFISDFHTHSATRDIFSITYILNQEAIDFMEQGGFTFQSHIVSMNLEKLKAEIEQLKTDSPVRAERMTTIVNNILSSLQILKFFE
ncbi:hypothetical protein [Siphonobacter sp. SORGH_AS_1065]|uniref:hypothetical protein n=1 Tax=Siphonobacter sp. SORGH_AS_1065 TaxID=3041795 RepID=UPI00277D3EFB|nr:hypothetical protein [Siphonobacter sp. SORGH_AS_1065]MDQ1088609.1 Fe2+ or Zn2+ uptake regulation protein [Siphonobacter sp. SORGH_AS_1065]